MHLHGPPTVLTVNLGAKYFSTRLRPLASFPLSPRDCGCCGVLNTTLPSIAITAESAPWAVLFDRSTLESPCIPEMRSASSTNEVVPATRRSSLGNRTFPVAGAQAWNALPPRCHLRTVPLFISATSEDFPVPATTASITLITVLWS